VDGETSRKTVLIAAAGCGAGRELAAGFAAAGALVIVADHAEPRALALARHAPREIESLTIDYMRPGPCRTLGEIWADTPLDLLVHLHPLRSPRRLGAAVSAIPALTRALLPGLARGDGLVLVICRAPRRSARPEELAFDTALAALAPHMQAEVGTRARVNVLRLGQDTGREVLMQVARRLSGDARGGPRGEVIELAGAGFTTRGQCD